jgi:hypothetical protein
MNANLIEDLKTCLCFEPAASRHEHTIAFGRAHPVATTLRRDRIQTVIVSEKAAAPVSAPWWAHVLWVVAAAMLGFAVAAIFAGLLHLPRALFLVPYMVLGSAFLYGYVRWSGVDVGRSVRRHWRSRWLRTVFAALTLGLAQVAYGVTRFANAADLSMAAMTSWRRTASAKSGTVCVPWSMSAANAA